MSVETSSIAQDAASTTGTSAAAHPVVKARAERGGVKLGFLVPTLYILFLMVPIYWLVNLSFKNNTEIMTSVTLWPAARP